MKKALLPIFWIIALIGIFQLADSFKSKSEHFFGLADTREQSISFQYPVEIVQALAVEGEDAKQGMPILVVRRNDLSSSRTTLDEQIRKLELDKKEAKATITSQIQSLTANKQSTLADIDQQIHAIETRIQLNRQNRILLESISGVPNNEIPPAPETFEVLDLEKKRHFAAKAIQAEIDNLTTQLNSTNRPIDAQIAELKNNKAELQRQNKSLTVTAQFNGRIGSVLYKPSDLVAAYQPIMTVHSTTPRSVKGYVHENILNEVKVGQTVWVKSLGLDHDTPPLEGVVESLGNRIVDYPERLKKDPQISTFGREVVVGLPSNNPLLFGEKVDISLNQKAPPFQWLDVVIATANGVIHNLEKPEPLHKSATASPDIMKNLEASALLWNLKEDHYLLLSDEQDDDRPGIFILDKNAAVTERLTLQEDTSIDDLESISADGDYIYVSSSLSYNRKDELKAKRSKLLRFKYKQYTASSQQEIDLFDTLTTITQDQPDTKVAKFLAQAMNDHSIDIESHFVKDNALYLGFKAPFIDDTATVIIKLNDLEAAFAGKGTSADIWKTIALTDPETGEPTQLSDMLFLEDKLILLSVSRTSTKNSHLWSYGIKDNTLKNLQQFTGVNAEGITYRSDQDAYVIVFDEGKYATSKFQTIKIPDAGAKK
jgi:multidrug resistance efflux pump